MQGREEVFANVSAGADKKSEHSGPVRAPSSLLEHLQRQVALKSQSARAAPPSGPRRFSARLPARERGCQWALTRKRTLWGGGALDRGHGASLKRLAQLGDALGGVGAVASLIKTAELVVHQAAKVVSGSVNGG